MVSKDSPSGTMVSKDSPSGTMMVKDNGTMVTKSDSPSGTVVLHANATLTGGALAAAAAAMRPSAGVGQSVAPSTANPEVCVRYLCAMCAICARVRVCMFGVCGAYARANVL